MLRFSLLFLCFFFFLLACGNDFSQVKAKGYVVTAEQDELSEEWRDYVFQQLANRSLNSSEIQKAEKGAEIPKGYKVLHFEIAEDLEYDYCIDHTQDKLYVRVRSKKISTWMSYQLIEQLGQSKPEIAVTDLPPSYISFTTQCKNFDFSYREPHYKPNTDIAYAAILGTDNIDLQWGIWGHNLPKIVDDHPLVWAEYKGVKTRDQYCFSSEELYEQLQTYIASNFGDQFEDAMNFMIAPNDNAISCMCERCKMLGNTQDNAAAAVTFLINKLAKHFRQHQFFTLVYQSIKEPSSVALENNGGVFFSTINLPRKIQLKSSPSFDEMKRNISKWQSKSSKVYLWDYASNFDDYLTPLPSLAVLQEQLKLYLAEGIDGLFINASGYDYSSFDGLKTYVSAALMIDTTLDYKQLVRAYFKKFYPISNPLLIEYYLKIEEEFSKKEVEYPLYGSFLEARSAYFNEQLFLEFLKSLQEVIPTIPVSERESLEQVYNGFLMTELQIAYYRGFGVDGAFYEEDGYVKLKPLIYEKIQQLEKVVQNKQVDTYREENGELVAYIKDWYTYVQESKAVNTLQADQLLSVTDQKGKTFDQQVLSDGILGFLSDYHQGWLTSNHGLVLHLRAETFRGKSQLALRFLVNERHRYVAPIEIVAWQKDKKIWSYNQSQWTYTEGLAQVAIPINPSDFAQNEEIKVIVHMPNAYRIGMDEVQVFN